MDLQSLVIWVIPTAVGLGWPWRWAKGYSTGRGGSQECFASRQEVLRMFVAGFLKSVPRLKSGHQPGPALFFIALPPERRLISLQSEHKYSVGSGQLFWTPG